MDTTNLKAKFPALIDYMKTNSYNTSYITGITGEFNKILKHAGEIIDYKDYYFKEYKNKKYKGYHSSKQYVSILYNLDVFGRFPNRNTSHHQFLDNTYYARLNGEYKGLIDIAKNTIYMNYKGDGINKYVEECSHLFLYFQEDCKKKIDEISEQDVLDFFIDENGNSKFNRSFIKSVTPMLKNMVSSNAHCQRILQYLPKIRLVRKNIQYLTEDEISKIKVILSDESNTALLRERAIVSLCLYTGLRSCDIANLKLKDIDWKNETISLKQEKTGVPLYLPLLTPVGNLLSEYIETQRPITMCEYVFICKDRDDGISSDCIYKCVNKVMSAANIRTEPGNRRGCHIFRHHLATSLLSLNVPQPVISQTLGHSSPSSLNPYLYSDFVHLKQCALSIEQFPIYKEGVEEK